MNQYVHYRESQKSKRERSRKLTQWNNSWKFTNLRKERDIQIKNAQRTPIEINRSLPTPRHILVKFAKYRDKERILKVVRGTKSPNLQGKTNQVSSRSIQRNLAGQKRVEWYTELAEWGKYAVKNILPSKAVIQNRRRDKESPKQKQKEFMTTKLALQGVLKKTLWGGKKGQKQQRLDRNREKLQKQQLYR